MLYCYSKKCFTVIIILMLMLVQASYAATRYTKVSQSNKTPDWVTGTVINTEGKVIKDVKVTIKNTATFVMTDDKGHFEIKAPQESVLVFSAPNYYVTEVTVEDTAQITVRMVDSYLQAPQRISVLYDTQNAENSVGSISSVYTNQLTTTNASMFLYALPGQLAGLYTQQTSGFMTFSTLNNTVSNGFALDGNIATENVHHTNNTEMGLNLRGQAPITIIDGVQRDIDQIDPSSIESISVLKDALSCMLLGINSSKGILLVTTKKAEAGRPTISFTAESGVQNSLNMPTPLPAAQWAYLYNEALTNDGLPPLYTGADFTAYQNHTDPYGHPDVNWFNTLLRKNAPITNYSLNVTGGNEVSKYTIGLSYFDQQGIFNTDKSLTYNTNNDLNRYNINSDVQVNVNKHLSVDLQLFGRVERATEPGAGTQNILNLLYTTPNNAYPIYNPNGSFGGNPVSSLYQNNLLSMTENSGYINNNTDDIMANLSLNYDLGSVTKGLQLKLMGNLSYESVIFLNRSLQNPTYSYKDSVYSSLGTSSPESNSYGTLYTSRQSYYQAALNYNRQFGKQGVSAMLFIDSKSMVNNYDLPEVVDNRALKLDYNYDGKYLAEGVINNSSDNRYPPGYGSGWFYALGLGWQMGKEDFMKDVSWISSWKWRADYGHTGNANIDSYSYYGYAQTYVSGEGGYFYLPVGASETNAYVEHPFPLAVNPYETFERGNKLDVGADVSFLKNHLSVTADYYHDRYSDILELPGAQISFLGEPYPYTNIGINEYHGIEFSATYKDNLGKFNYFVTGNISTQASKVIYNDEAKLYPLSLHTGLPVTAIFGYKADGFYETAAQAAAAPTLNGYQPRPGDIRLEDLSGPNGKPDGILDQFDMVPIGGLKPLVFYGGTIGFNYGGFNFSVILQGVFNRQIDIESQLTQPFAGINTLGLPPQGQAYVDASARWTPETASQAKLPELSFVNNVYGGYDSQFSSFWLRSGDYLRVKNAELGYTLPYQWASALKLSNIRVFINGENLLTKAAFGNVDPEVNPSGGNYPYPIQRVVSAGINVKL
jgi:TonB-linked SusC/RagA family outer membrane protein